MKNLNYNFNDFYIDINSVDINNFSKKKLYTSYSKKSEIKFISIGLASPEKIKKWAEKILPNGKIVGKIVSANTLHYKTFQPQKGGLFCERIFGPLKDFFCACGKSSTLSIKKKNKPTFKGSSYNSILHINEPNNKELKFEPISKKFCPDCEVEYTFSLIRRYQLGYIELASPVTHVWYLKGMPNNISILLGIKKRPLLNIVYCSETITLENVLNKSEIERTPKELISFWQKNIKPKLNYNNVQLSNQALSKISRFNKDKIYGTNNILDRNSSRNQPKLIQIKRILQIKKRKNLKIIKKLYSIKLLLLYLKWFDITNKPITHKLKQRKKKAQKNRSFRKNFRSLYHFKKFVRYFPIHCYILRNLDLSLQQEIVYHSNKISYSKMYNNFLLKKYDQFLNEKFPANDSFRKNWFIAFQIFYQLGRLKKWCDSNNDQNNLKKYLKNYKKWTLFLKKLILAKKTNKESIREINKPLRLKVNQYLKNYPTSPLKPSIFLPGKICVDFKTTCHEFFNLIRKNKFLKSYPQEWFPCSREIYEKFLKKKSDIWVNKKSLENFIRLWLSSFNILTITYNKSFQKLYKIKNLPTNKILNSFIKKLFTFPKTFWKYNLYYSVYKLNWKANSSKLEKNLINFFSHFKKTSLKKKQEIRNNNYCFSYRERWFDIEKDDNKEWPNFSFYFNLENNLLNLPIPIYKNRLNRLNNNYQASLENLNKVDKLTVEKKINFFTSEVFKLNQAKLTNLNNRSTKKDFDSFFCSGPAVIRHLLSEFTHLELKLVEINNQKRINEIKKAMVGLLNKNKDLNHLYSYKFYRYNSSPIPKQTRFTPKSKRKVKRLFQDIIFSDEDIIFLYTEIFKEDDKQKDKKITLEKIREEFFSGHINQNSKKFNLLIRNQKLIKKLIKKSSDPKLMTLISLPVLPPDLRPIVKMDDQLASSDLNRLYQRIIYRNERLKRLLNNSFMCNSSLMHFVLRLVQEAVDNLISNGKTGVTPETDSRDRLLKSLSDILKGKEGRFRQYLLGKRVDYSGRSVIVVGPNLQLHECGIPKEMAFELFLPFLLKNILNQKRARTIIGAKIFLKKHPALAWELLQETMQTCPVLLNRAPTLHRLGIQAFQPKLIEGKAILLHPLVCSAFNADFDGDQMAVHIPLTVEARAEAWKLMLSVNNLLSPATGEPLAIPSQDMVLGCYYLTTNCNKKNIKYQRGSGLYFTNLTDVIKNYENKKLDLHSIIWLKWNGYLETGNDQEQPLEIRMNCYGNYQEIYSKFQKHYNKNNLLVNQYVSTTPGKVLFNFMVQKTLTNFSKVFI